ncbi:lysophospholipase [Brachyspira hampsonii]|uniref:Lysophospholipase n=1 Tax=Brachyspira hampsonii TaxID=1287055 RepID=A0A1E5NDF7_9SPIR|nr:alpha/beta fold hydrolase [Brachyspira hampsonii]OEJ14137.1 lysophospholipase [Brachyspira hampsonii]
MEMLNRVLISDDGHRMYTYIFIPDCKPKAIVQLVHGLGEHAGRYKDFAEKLNKAGFLVCADDHRGFGRSTVSKDQIGHISDKNGHELIIEDMRHLMVNTKADYSNMPYFMIGHSMGSFLTRYFIIKYYKELNGAVIMGTKGKPKGIENLGKAIANIQKSIFGGRKRANLLDKLSVGGYGKKFFPKDKSPLAWLTSDKEEIKKTLEDEYFANKPASIETYIQMFELIDKISNKDNYSSMDKNFPILLISGEKDPVGDMGKGVKWVYDMYKSLGFNDVNMSLYKDGRHEILNDIQRNDVAKEIIEWINIHIDK